MSEIHEKQVNENRIDTIMAEDINFIGECTFMKELIIKGRYSGKINAKGNLHIAGEATVKADINAKSVFISGNVSGQIHASVSVELLGDAVVIGDITAPKIEMSPGCRFDGLSRMEPPKDNR